ncbi:MAG: hypothetical protein OXB86_01190 [Bdellovibrionales bacterium]|nr:hypothetical protein [Bdellovibrionales bacterium]
MGLKIKSYIIMLLTGCFLQHFSWAVGEGSIQSRFDLTGLDQNMTCTETQEDSLCENIRKVEKVLGELDLRYDLEEAKENLKEAVTAFSEKQDIFEEKKNFFDYRKSVATRMSGASGMAQQTAQSYLMQSRQGMNTAEQDVIESEQRLAEAMKEFEKACQISYCYE